jgi:hypothetical protein
MSFQRGVLIVAEGARAENSQAKVPDSDETPKSRGFGV